jgi:hypothetical protein
MYKESYSSPFYCFNFKQNGECFYYYYKIDSISKVRLLYDFEDVIVPNTWKIYNNNTIQIQGVIYNIKLITEKQMILVNQKFSKDSLHLVPSKVETSKMK